MNETNLTYSPDCPEFVELSAWMDGEGQASVGEHVSKCRACDQTVKFYRKVDRAVVSAMAPSADLAARIKVACAKERGTPLLRFWPAAPWRLAAAAALVVAAALATYRYASIPTPTAPEVAAAVPVIPAEATARQETVSGDTVDEALAQSDDYVWDNDAEEWVVRGSVRSADLTMATAGVADGGTRDRAVREMAAAVRHVWVVADVQKTVRLIQNKLAPELTSELQTLPTNRPVTLRLVLKDRELQGVVDQLSAAGASLVSPQLPQPGEARRILAVGKPVMYEAELVPAPSSR